MLFYFPKQQKKMQWNTLIFLNQNSAGIDVIIWQIIWKNRKVNVKAED